MFIEAFRDYLAANGFGTAGTDLFLWFPPNVTALSTTIAQYTGAVPNAKFAIDTARLQLRVRGTDTQQVVTRAYALYTALQSLSNTSMGAYAVLDCQALQSGPVFLGRNEANLNEFVLNIEIIHYVPAADQGQRALLGA